MRRSPTGCALEILSVPANAQPIVASIARRMTIRLSIATRPLLAVWKSPRIALRKKCRPVTPALVRRYEAPPFLMAIEVMQLANTRNRRGSVTTSGFQRSRSCSSQKPRSRLGIAEEQCEFHRTYLSCKRLPITSAFVFVVGKKACGCQVRRWVVAPLRPGFNLVKDPVGGGHIMRSTSEKC